MQIPISQSDSRDQLVWQLEKHGNYTVKSAYKLTQLHQESKISKAETSCAAAKRTSMWKKVWKLSVKPKVRHFLWKCLNGWLATNGAVKRRGVIIDDTCRRCGLDSESNEHLFFHCEESVLAWKIAPVHWNKQQHLTSSFEDWWQAISSVGRNKNSQKGVEFTAYLLWNIWKARNQCQFQDTKMNAVDVVQKALHEWMEYDEMLEQAKKRGGSRGRPHPVQHANDTAPAECIRIFVASEIGKAEEGAGLGYSFKNAQGCTFLAKAECSRVITDPCIAEMEVIRRALFEAKLRKLQDVEIRLDVKGMVAWLQRKTPPVAEAVSIVEDIF